MRPELIQMAGFGAFRTDTEVDLTDVDLFALTGPTGAGKSTVIDAITFALYGVVPRHGKGSVAPVISLGLSEARVRLDFSIGDDRYTAVRVVRRSAAGGASTEARLEGGGAVVSGPREVTQAVETLLGLTVDHFTRSVVLPQGEFAAFLLDKPSAQQDLVKALLDMGVLEEIRALALGREKTNDELAAHAAHNLDALAGISSEDLSEAQARVEALAAATTDVERWGADQRALQARIDAKKARLDELQGIGDALAAIEAPDGIDDLVVRADTARKAHAGAEERLETLGTRETELRQTLDSLPGPGEIDAHRANYARLQRLKDDLVGIDAAAASANLETAESDVVRAIAERDAGRASVISIRERAVAHTLASGLEVGDACPVCGDPISELPAIEPPSDLAEAVAIEAGAEQALVDARSALEQAKRLLTEAVTRRTSLADQIEQVALSLKEAPKADQLEEQARQVEAARLAVEEVVSLRAKAAKSVAATRRDLESALAAEGRLRGRFDASRDAVAAFGPPPPARDDVAEDWEALVAWAENLADKTRAEATSTLQETAELELELAAATSAINERLALLDVGGSGTPMARLTEARVASAQVATSLEEKLARKQGLEADVKRATESATVARSLRDHLRSNRFEAWMLRGAIDSLLAGANSLLAHLSDGAYSLGFSDRAIDVIDHRNADATRSVKSLSGGETFLVSLALALSLGEQLAGLSPHGMARLDAIFLDEGFGTLDEETLDLVGSVVSELAATGRMVGLVTHVKDLAAQVPVRFEVTPSPAGSTIARTGGATP